MVPILIGMGKALGKEVVVEFEVFNELLNDGGGGGHCQRETKEKQKRKRKSMVSNEDSIKAKAAYL